MERIQVVEDAPAVVREVCKNLLGYDPPPHHLDLMVSTGAVQSQYRSRVGYIIYCGYWWVHPGVAFRIFKDFLAQAQDGTDTGRKTIAIREAITSYIQPCDKFWVPSPNWFADRLMWDDELCIALARLIYYCNARRVIPCVEQQHVYWSHVYNLGFEYINRKKYKKWRQELGIPALIENEYKKTPYQPPTR